MIDDLGALDSPADMQDAVDQFLADAQSALDDIVATQNPDAFAEVNPSANELGLTACSEDTTADD